MAESAGTEKNDVVIKPEFSHIEPIYQLGPHISRAPVQEYRRFSGRFFIERPMEKMLESVKDDPMDNDHSRSSLFLPVEFPPSGQIPATRVWLH